MLSNNHILKNLRSVIRNSTLTYMNEFVWQDIELTDEFQKAYEEFLGKTHYTVEFLGSTAVITSPYSKYIFVPNQWFVIASYAVDVYEELYRYKDYFKKVAERLHRRPKQLRDSATLSDQNEFIDCAKEVFFSFCSNDSMVEESASRLWRFVNDYSWWSGQKTIDRGDFHVSVILNMLNLVNLSQGYVADIVGGYANDNHLRTIVKTIGGFTTNMAENIENPNKDYIVPDEELGTPKNITKEPELECDAMPAPERVKIKIKGKSKLKEFKYKK